MWFLALPPTEQLAPENRAKGVNAISTESPTTLGLHAAAKMPALYRDAWTRMQAEMQIVQTAIEARTAKTGHYYPYLEPHSIPVSISI